MSGMTYGAEPRADIGDIEMYNGIRHQKFRIFIAGNPIYF
jgi:hypothetical protein